MKDENGKKELAEVKGGVPAFSFNEDVGAGMEGADKDCFAIPFLRIIQKGSPQVDETSAMFNANAKAGMFLNSVTGEMFDGKAGITIVPCAFQRRFVRWGGEGQPDEGKFKGEMLPEEVAQLRDSGKVIDMDGQLTIENDELTDTRSHYVLLVTESGVTQVLMPMTSTQIKKSKQLLSILSSIKVRSGDALVTPPTWLNKIRVTSVPESNEKGSWYGFKFEADGFVDDEETYNTGKKLHETVIAGGVKANYAADEGAEPNKF